MTAPLDANEVRKDFELSMVFGIRGVPCGPGGLMREASNGNYIVPAVEHAWLGYLARASSEHAQRERLSATRFIGNGDRLAVRELMIYHLADGPASDDESIEQFARAILKHFKGMPT